MAYSEIRITPVSIGQPFWIDPTLTGVVFHIEFVWNTRGQYWTLHFSDAGRNPILQGVRGVVDYPLLIRSSDENRPIGQLYLVDTSQQGLDPGPYDLGDRVRLMYDDEQDA